MRFLAAADLHVGASTDHRHDALGDQTANLAQIVDVAREYEVDAVLIAGDVFHRPKPTPPELHVFAGLVAQLERAGIPAIAIHGNVAHDGGASDEPTALELFASDWLRVSRTPEVIRTVGDVAVCTLPNVAPGRLRALLADRGALDETNETKAELLVGVAADLRAQVPDGWPCVLLGHWSVSGASLPNGLPAATLREPVLDLAALEAQRWSHVVMGHLHRQQWLSTASISAANYVGFYCGSPMTMDFGEAEYEHGVWIVPMDKYPTYPTFVPLVDRRFVTVSVDLTADDAYRAATDLPGVVLDETDLIAEALSQHLPLADAVVRVSYRATEEQHRRVDHAALTAFLADARVHRVYGGIKWIPVKAERARAEGIDETLDPLAAVKLWASVHEVGEERTRGLLDLTTEALGVVGA